MMMMMMMMMMMRISTIVATVVPETSNWYGGFPCQSPLKACLALIFDVNLSCMLLLPYL